MTRQLARNESPAAWRFRQLFVNSERRSRTRLPKQFVYAPDHIVPTWRNLRDVEVVGITRWLDDRLPIERVNGATRTVTFDRYGIGGFELTCRRNLIYYQEPSRKSGESASFDYTRIAV